MPKLTKRLVEQVPVPAKVPGKVTDIIVWDDMLPGFGVRVWPTGKRNYILQYRTKQGKQRKRTLGQHGVLTTEQARQMARAWLVDVQHGGDPVTTLKAARQSPTLMELADRYMREYALVKKKPSSIALDERNLRLHILPALGQTRVAALTREDVTALHHRMRATPGAANRCLTLLQKMCTLAELWGFRPDGSNPVRHIPRYRERRIERYLSVEELARLGQVLAETERTQTEAPSVLALVRLLLYTGARLREILTLRWTDVDLDRARLFLPDSKTGAKTIYLPPPAVDVLRTIARRPENPYVITGKKPGTHWSNIHAAWHRLRVQAGLDDVRLHDLRHTFASVGAAAGLSLPIIGKLLGHQYASTTDRYAHLAADPVQTAAVAIGEVLAKALQGQEPGQDG